MAESGAAASYRHHAANCIEIARLVSDPAGRTALLSMAQAWLLLAERADKNTGAPTLVDEMPEQRQQPAQQRYPRR
jgi:hypothetical protein